MASVDLSPLPGEHGGAAISRRRFLAVAGALGTSGGVITAAAVETHRVTVTRHRLGDWRPVENPVLRIVQLSDLHLQAVGRHERRIAAAVHGLAPDLVVFTGDSVDRPDRLEQLNTFLALLDRSVPKYAILGNWEYWAGVSIPRLAAAYAAHNGRLLVDQSVRFRHHGRNVLITGLDDLVAGEPDLDRALRSTEPAANHLVLAHCPAHHDVLRATLSGATPGGHAPRYVFSGHTHGGQIAAFGYAPLRPAGSGAYVRGWYHDDWPRLYVSRGLGTSVFPFRLGSPPEVACFEWSLS